MSLIRPGEEGVFRVLPVRTKMYIIVQTAPLVQSACKVKVPSQIVSVGRDTLDLMGVNVICVHLANIKIPYPQHSAQNVMIVLQVTNQILPEHFVTDATQDFTWILPPLGVQLVPAQKWQAQQNM